MKKFFVAALLSGIAVLSFASQSAEARLFSRHQYGPQPKYYNGYRHHLDYFSPHYGTFYHNSQIPYSEPIPTYGNNSGAWFPWR